MDRSYLISLIFRQKQVDTTGRPPARQESRRVCDKGTTGKKENLGFNKAQKNLQEYNLIKIFITFHDYEVIPTIIS